MLYVKALKNYLISCNIKKQKEYFEREIKLREELLEQRRKVVNEHKAKDSIKSIKAFSKRKQNL